MFYAVGIVRDRTLDSIGGHFPWRRIPIESVFRLHKLGLKFTKPRPQNCLIVSDGGLGDGGPAERLCPGLAWTAQVPKLHGGCRRNLGTRHRGEHRDFQPDQHIDASHASRRKTPRIGGIGKAKSEVPWRTESFLHQSTLGTDPGSSGSFLRCLRLEWDALRSV